MTEDYAHISAQPAAATWTVLYKGTAPVLRSNVVLLYICNQGATDDAYSLAMVTSGDPESPPDDKDIFAPGIAIAPGVFLQIVGPHLLSVGDSLLVHSVNGDIAFTGSALEISP